MRPLVSAVVGTGRGGASSAVTSPRERLPRPTGSGPSSARRSCAWSAILERWLGASSRRAVAWLERWRTAPSAATSVIGATERHVAIAVERWLGELSAQRATTRTQRRDPLEECLRALADQSLAATDYEIIVVDAAASATTRGLVARLSADHPQIAFDYVPAAGRDETSTPRHVSWRAAQADLVAFTRDDCVPDRFWLEAGLNAFQRPEAEGIVFADGRIEGARAPVHCNCFVRREALAAVDGLDVGRLRYRFGAQAFAHVPQATVRRPLPLVSAPRPAEHPRLDVASFGAAALGLLLRRRGLMLAGAFSWMALAYRRLHSRGAGVRHEGSARQAVGRGPRSFNGIDRSTQGQEVGMPP